MTSLKVLSFGVALFAIFMLSTADEAPTTAAPNALSPDKLAEKFSDLFHSFNHTANELYSSLSEKAKTQLTEASKKIQDTLSELKTKYEEHKDKPAAVPAAPAAA